MKAIIEALKALLQAHGVTVYYVQAPASPSYPYVLLWSTPGQPGIEAGVAPDGDLSDLLGITYVDTYAENVLLLSGTVRPLLDGAVLAISGLRVVLSLSASQTVQADEQVTLPDTGRHPCYAVDRYRLVATPA